MWGQLLILYKVCGVKKNGGKTKRVLGRKGGLKKKNIKNLPLQVPPYYVVYKMYQKHGIW